jgi:hypothetical protein
MYKIKCTGLNLNYGKKDEIRLVADTYVSIGVRKKWFKIISFEGSLKPYTKFFLEQSISNIDNHIKNLEQRKRFYEDKLKTFKVK